MRLVRVDRIADGMELARDVPAESLGSAPLLRQGVRLSGAVAASLERRGVRAVWIEDDLGEGIVPMQPLSDDVRRSAERAVVTCLDRARETGGAAPIADDVLQHLETAARGVMDAMEDCPEAALALDDLASADTYTYSHSIRVTTLGMVLGHRITRLDGWVDWRGRRRYDNVPARMAEMAMGLLIHDIGKIAVPETILNKPGPLTAEEWELIRMHPSAGASLLPPDRVSPRSIAIVRDHHERWDGDGYESGRAAEEIHPFARIASVADVYDAITADRPYKAANPPHVGVRVIREGAGTQFDPIVVGHFLHVAMPYPVGWEVALPDGSAGVVADVDPTQPETPLVRHLDPAGRICETELHIVDGVVRDEREGLYN
ncbi:MAG TPA: HD-GYP domain-containing protein [Solirubrobacteraceae bacterium]|nr:HD-GYP domain-containing protein [Solirubrobacteraceae bacterium]